MFEFRENEIIVNTEYIQNTGAMGGHGGGMHQVILPNGQTAYITAGVAAAPAKAEAAYAVPAQPQVVYATAQYANTAAPQQQQYYAPQGQQQPQMYTPQGQQMQQYPPQQQQHYSSQSQPVAAYTSTAQYNGPSSDAPPAYGSD